METLSEALARRGHELCLVMPAYRSVLRGEFALAESPLKVTVPVPNRQVEASVLQTSLAEKIVVYFIRADSYYDRESLYGTAAGDYPDNAERFAFFCRAALEVLRYHPVEVIHGHDWQSAFAVIALKAQAVRYPELAAAKTVFTIHNLGFQGIFREPDWDLLNLDRSLLTPPYLEFFGNINLLKGALVFADKITTVSPSYAGEIMSAEQGFGLEGVLRERAGDVVGILNGVDYSRWNPQTDPCIAKRYDANSLTAKGDCKRSLSLDLGLPDSKAPLIGIISRLTDQKGLDLIEATLDELIARDVKLIVLGSGEPHYERFFAQAAERYPAKIAVRIGFDEAMAHKIEAGADIFLMPSRYEPCGLNQMYSLKYGTIPVVRGVGGLKDTVKDYDSHSGTGTGFVFTDYKPQALLHALERALRVFNDPREWTILCRRAMSMNFSWERSAEHYDELYQKLTQ